MILTIIPVVMASVLCTLSTPLDVTSMKSLALDKRGAPFVKDNHYTSQ